MFRYFQVLATAAAMVMAASAALADAQPLRLDEAVEIALMIDDPSVRLHDARAEALEDRAVADAQLPDPTARAALVNVPVNSFDLEQENMTQLQLGLRQEFPRGRTLELNGERRRMQSAAERLRQDLRRREITLAVRTAWLDEFYWTHAQEIVRESRAAVDELIDALSASFASGAMTSQDVLRAELELALLDDRLVEMERQAMRAQADLARFIAGAAERPLPDHFRDPPPPAPLDILESALPGHPKVGAEDAAIAVEATDIELAEQAYRPSWGVETGYGLRGGGRSDFASIGVTVSLPLFADKRQDRRLAASIKDRSAAELARAALLLDMRRDLGRAYADWTRLERRVRLYDEVVIVRADDTAEASVTAYGGGLADFPELIRAQLAQLDAEIDRLRLKTERAKAWAAIQFLAGDVQ